jgi:hypothetical protein
MATDEELSKVAQDALERYWRAVELADATRLAWEEDGRLLTVVWPNGIESEAPLLKLMRETERDAERFGRAIPRPAGKPGRPQRAVVEASPAASLRRVR